MNQPQEPEVLNHKDSDLDIQLEEFLRNYKLSLSLIEKSKDRNELFEQILDQYISRFEEIPATDILKTHKSSTMTFDKQKIKSLIMFATQAGMLKENADYLDEIKNKNKQLKLLIKNLNNSNEQLRRLNSHYLNMLSFVSHELRSPLVSMLGFAELLDEELFGNLNIKQKESVQIIIRGTKNLLSMTKNYLDLSRIENGEFKLFFQTVNIQKDVIEQVKRELKKQLENREMRIIELTDESTPDIILLCDPELIRNVFYNLFSNAIKYGISKNDIQYEIMNEPGNVKFIVQNNCNGLPQDKLKHIFQKFTHLDQEITDEKPRGTGLGLYISKLIIHSHGGRIWAESDSKSWVKLIFTLPKGKLRQSKVIEYNLNRNNFYDHFFQSPEKLIEF